MVYENVFAGAPDVSSVKAGFFFRQNPIPFMDGFLFLFLAFFIPLAPVIRFVVIIGQTWFGCCFPLKVGIFFEIAFQ